MNIGKNLTVVYRRTEELDIGVKAAPPTAVAEPVPILLISTANAVIPSGARGA